MGTLLLTLAGTASAASPEADRLNGQALTAYADGDYLTAALAFADAYALDPDPMFRRSEALSWFKAGDCKRAMTAANAFLHTKPPAEMSAEPTAVVANCKVTFAEDAVKVGSYDLADRLLFEAEELANDRYTEDRIVAVRVELANLRQNQTSTAPAAETPPPDVEQTKETIEPLRPAPRSNTPGWIAMGVGAGALTAAIVWHVVALTRTVPQLELESDGGDRARHQRLSRQTTTARTVVPLLYAVGTVGIGLGVWHTINVQGGDRSVGLSWATRF